MQWKGLGFTVRRVVASKTVSSDDQDGKTLKLFDLRQWLMKEKVDITWTGKMGHKKLAV